MNTGATRPESEQNGCLFRTYNLIEKLPSLLFPIGDQKHITITAVISRAYLTRERHLTERHLSFLKLLTSD
ncbi:hypothetical protein PoB_001805300 [Plakobranchus ocellatus]|uniref:Uncharacterized protein n=1 Tax=Plakobranchus ocellatus TaxID=259542 RepID=A0AAV3Z9V9_9GAST|nr:hypothetical protein PoB_001805300 [Plakobranchus ocellatus]